MQENVGTLVTAQHVWSPFYVDDMIETDTNPDVTSNQSNGSVDTSFGTNTTAHTTTTSLSSSPASAKAIAVGSDILVAAMVGSTPELLFYNSSGGLDTAYGSGTGIVSLTFTGWTAITGIVVQSDGDIDLAVTTSSGGMNVAQLNYDGSADTVFGSSGLETLSSLPAARGIVIAPNGDLLVAGLSTATFKVAELNPSTGSQDTSYNTSGTASIVSNSNGSTVIYIGMALMPDGDLLLSGRYVTSGPPTRYYLAMVAITPTGVGDSTFGTSNGISGRYTQEWDNPFAPGDTPMVVSPTGQIFIGYASASVGHQFLAVFEFNPNGSLNTSFGDDGIASANLSSGTTNIVLAIETNGQIVIGDGSGSGTFNLVRFNADGSLDTTFGSSGVESGASESGGLAMVIAPSGETVMVGKPSSGSGIILQEFHTLANAQRVYVEQDADYNVTSITNTSGNVVERYEYDPYGNVTVLNADGTVRGGGTAASSFYASVYLHQGLRLDVVTGTYDDRSRAYIATLGRFTAEDPSGYVNGKNMYQFVLSSPVDLLDPSGRSFWAHVAKVASALGRIAASTGAGAATGAAAGAATGAVVGGVAGAVGGAGVGAIPGAGAGAAAGAVGGGIAGGISGLVSGVVNELKGSPTLGQQVKGGAVSGTISGATGGVLPGLGAGVGVELGVGTGAAVNGAAGAVGGGVSAGVSGGGPKQIAGGAIIGGVSGAIGGAAAGGGASTQVTGVLSGVDGEVGGQAVGSTQNKNQH